MTPELSEKLKDSELVLFDGTLGKMMKWRLAKLVKKQDKEWVI